MSHAVRLLLLSDYDKTIAATFEPSPNRLDVHRVHHLTIQDLFGADTLGLYHEHGGLRNRAPGELIGSLIELDPGLTTRALGGHSRDLDQQQVIREITEIFVKRKLKYLLAEISPQWPRPCEGFLDFHRCLTVLRDKGIDAELGILSSGHTSFISRTFEQWGIACPRVMVTDDHVRNLRRPKHMEDRIKPNIFPFNKAMAQWRRRHPEGKLPSRVIYFGDDPHKDGGLAINAGVPFGLFAEEEDDLSAYPVGSICFSDWRMVGERLIHRIRDLLQGLPCNEILI